MIQESGGVGKMGEMATFPKDAGVATLPEQDPEILVRIRGHVLDCWDVNGNAAGGSAKIKTLCESIKTAELGTSFCHGFSKWIRTVEN